MTLAATFTVINAIMFSPFAQANENRRFPTPVITEIEATGYISAMCLNVRQAPGVRSEIIAHLFKGDNVDIIESRSLGGAHQWRRVMDASGFVEGWVYGKYVSGDVVKSDFVIPDDYKEPKTPSLMENVSAKYVGVAACQTCHDKPHGGFALGEYGVWRDHYHADAFETLKKSYTKAFAKKRGVDDPLTDWRCRKCHVTALGAPPERLAASYRDEDGVGCEVCHGPGGDYLNDHWPGTAGYEKRETLGFRVLRDIEERDQFCRSCHNPLSPTYKPFNVAAFSEAIRHWPEEDFQAFAEAKNAGVPEAQQIAQTPPKPVPQKTVPPPKLPAAKKDAKPAPAPTNGGARLAGAPKETFLNRNGAKRGKVFFSHFAHFDYVEAETEAENCLVCHHTTKPKARPENCGVCHKVQPTAAAPSREKAFHNTCRACHKEIEAGPRTCTQCHEL